MRKNKQYSNGKLLISGEYLVLKGAKALALPINRGQSLQITQNANKGIINWQARHEKGKWFEATIHLDQSSGNLRAMSEEERTLAAIIKNLNNLCPGFFDKQKGYLVKTGLDFLPEHGLGSSSTLINNLSKAAGCDAYKLLSLTFGGSGYDIACAQHDKAIIFRLENGKENVEEQDFNPAFAENIFFAYLGKKQKSSKSIEYFNKNAVYSSDIIEQISNISEDLILAKDLAQFNELIERHEKIMSQVLQIEPVKHLLFNDLNASVKSLGAWGGDFVMISTELKKTELINYLRNKGYKTIYQFNDLLIR
ncbi:MAG: GHMP kinase [Chlorobi bacterium]|nr:GHMP kinase [Chlorobiota bacterium]